MKVNMNALRALEQSMKAHSEIYDQLPRELRDDLPAPFNDIDSRLWYGFRSAWFAIVTGEPDFNDFYDRFDAPGSTRGLKPVAWNPRFIPDLIGDLFFEFGKPLEERVKEVQRMYKECRALEKAFEPSPRANPMQDAMDSRAAKFKKQIASHEIKSSGSAG